MTNGMLELYATAETMDLPRDKRIDRQYRGKTVSARVFSSGGIPEVLIDNRIVTGFTRDYIFKNLTPVD